MLKSSNINILSKSPLPSPAEVKKALPCGEAVKQTVVESRNAIEKILDGESSRFLMIVGPCSIHDSRGAMEYARRLKKLSDEVADKIMVVMRAYFEKPRTTLGWKGLIYDPEINGSYNIEKGLYLARKILLEIIAAGVPTGSEMLDPIIPAYIADVVVWAAIGARTAESQTHRQLASGLSMPIGIKNATDGSIQAAIDAINTATAKHSFIGITDDGRTAVFRTRGNRYTHIVLRGGDKPNYGAEYIAFVKTAMKKAGLKSNIIVDCSHANSGKNYKLQRNALFDVLAQIDGGEKSIIGCMLESNLIEGRQEVTDASAIVPGLSLTDSCIGWEETEELIRTAYRRL